MASNHMAEWNGGDDEDEALRQAIAMSLGESLPRGDSDATGSNNGYSASVPANDDESSSSLSGIENVILPPSSMSALGLDRKKMEEERLARLKKRKAESNLDAQGRDEVLPPSQRPKLMDVKAVDKPKLPHSALPTSASSLESNVYSTKASSGIPSLPYPKGTVLRTWVRGNPREDDIKIEEVLQKDDLELAVLSSFQWDEDWLMEKLNLRKTKVLLVAYAADEATKAAMRDNVPKDLIRFCFPPMEHGASCMHSKLQLLKYPKYLRIVVPSGNLVPYDWGETGVMENMVFLIDLPRIEDPAERAANVLTPFGDELQFFLKAQGIDEKMVASLRNYDFSETSRYGFVHTIGGSHPDQDIWQRTGYCGLGRTVKALGLASDGRIDMDYICSSIGAVKSDLLTALYNACKGDLGMKEYDARTAKQKKGKGASPAPPQTEFPGQLRVYFPSLETVRQSRGGTNSAGTISFQSKWWNSESFPSEVLRDCKNARSDILMHSKVIFVRRPVAETGGSARGWAYTGSHNLSESAWGRLVKDRSTGQPKLNARNWECGVLCPVPSSHPPPIQDHKAAATPTNGTSEGPRMLDLFRDVLPIPIKLPGAQYIDGDEPGLRPWFSHEN